MGINNIKNAASCYSEAVFFVGKEQIMRVWGKAPLEGSCRPSAG